MKIKVGEALALSGEIMIPADTKATGDGPIGDFEVAAVWLTLAATAKLDSNVTMKSVGFNPARAGIVEALQKMGARLEVKRRPVGERTVADIWVRSSWLRSMTMEPDLLRRTIPDFELFSVAASLTDGVTIVRKPADLSPEEAQRIESVLKMLTAFQILWEEREGGEIWIQGEDHFHGGEYDCTGDGRMAIALGIAGLFASEDMIIDGAESAEDVYPGFWDDVTANTSARLEKS